MCWTATDYDILGRITKATGPDGSATAFAHEGFGTTATNALGQKTKETRNALGETASTGDHHGGAVELSRDAQGNVVKTTRRKPSSDASPAPASIATTAEFDLLGRMTAQDDPDLGRFLRADPFVQFPANLQSHNRYSYALNNPLAYTDPSGHFLKGLLRPLASVAISVWLPGAGIWTGTGLFAANGIGAVAASGFIAGAVGSGSLKGAVVGAFSAAAFNASAASASRRASSAPRSRR